MNIVFDKGLVSTEICHKDYNLDKKDNLQMLPEEPAIFGVFGIIHNTPKI